MNDNKSTEVLYQDTLPGGTHWSMLIRRGTTLRLIDDQGGANLAMLFYNPEEKLERYNAPDTLKCQHTFKLTKGHCLYSDMGRIFCSIIDDSVGWHDTASGNLDNATMTGKWAEKTYQEHRNNRNISGEDAFAIELAKYGLTKRDMVANINLFSKVSVDAKGNLSLVDSNSKTGDFVTLRFEMDTLVMMHTCPHPLSNASEYPKKPVTYQLMLSEPVQDDDLCMNACRENTCGFKNNALYHIGLSVNQTGAA